MFISRSPFWVILDAGSGEMGYIKKLGADVKDEKTERGERKLF
jgi:hypothetical protein